MSAACCASSRLLLYAACCLALSAPLAAGACEGFGQRDNFRAHQDNYLLVNRMANNGWADRDEWALRVQYSVRYTVCGAGNLAQRRMDKGYPALNKPEDWEVFIAYTGQFDFYWLGQDTRPSGPVINRLSNIGVHARLPARKWLPELDPNTELTLSLEHRSNGQTFETSTDRGTESAQLAHRARDRHFFDALSRGSDFLALSARGDAGPAAERTADLAAVLKLYLQQDSTVTWGPRAGHRLSDYDRLWLRAGRGLPRGLGYVEAAIRLGDKGLATASYDLGWQIEDGRSLGKWLPLYVRLHRGPMNTLSNFSQRQDSIGVGLRFTDF